MRRVPDGLGRSRLSSGAGSPPARPGGAAATAASRDRNRAPSPGGDGAGEGDPPCGERLRPVPHGSVPERAGRPARDRRPWPPPARTRAGGRPAVNPCRHTATRRTQFGDGRGDGRLAGSPVPASAIPGRRRGDLLGQCARDRWHRDRPAGDPGTDADRYSPRLGCSPVVEGLSPTPNRVPSPVDANRNRNPNHPLEAASRPALRTDRSEGLARRREATHPGCVSTTVVTPLRAARHPVVPRSHEVEFHRSRRVGSPSGPVFSLARSLACTVMPAEARGAKPCSRAREPVARPFSTPGPCHPPRPAIRAAENTPLGSGIPTARQPASPENPVRPHPARPRPRANPSFPRRALRADVSRRPPRRLRPRATLAATSEGTVPAAVPRPGNGVLHGRRGGRRRCRRPVDERRRPVYRPEGGRLRRALFGSIFRQEACRQNVVCAGPQIRFRFEGTELR